MATDAEVIDRLTGELREARQAHAPVTDWVREKEQPPPHDEPVIYAKPNPHKSGAWHVGIAYWTVSQKWSPEAESQHAPGFTHWKPLGGTPL